MLKFFHRVLGGTINHLVVKFFRPGASDNPPALSKKEKPWCFDFGVISSERGIESS